MDLERTGALVTRGEWESLLADAEGRSQLEALLPAYVSARRWYGGKARRMEGIAISGVFPIGHGGGQALITTLEVLYFDGSRQAYVLPLGFAAGEKAANLRRDSHHAVIAPMRARKTDGVLYDASADPDFALALLDAIAGSARFTSDGAEIRATPTSTFARLRPPDGASLEPRGLTVEQSNTSIRYGEHFILKLFRRLEEGTSPDLEVGLFLTSKSFPNTPPLAGAVEYVGNGAEPVTVAILQGFVRNQGDAWAYTLASLKDYYSRAAQMHETLADQFPAELHPIDLAAARPPEHTLRAIGDFLGAATLLGTRTAEMHAALASDPAHPDFMPEPFSGDYRQTLYGDINDLTRQAWQLLADRVESLPPGAREGAEELLRREPEVAARAELLIGTEIDAPATRVHGDYHLGQVLYTGQDFIIIDFEGEPARPLRERRRRHSPLKDVAGMVRSFHYAAYAALFDELAARASLPEEMQHLELWARSWYAWVSGAYLSGYLQVAGEAGLLPKRREDLQALFDAYLLEKAIYELLYELNNRPGWVRIPLEGITQLLDSPA